ncbi:hypothetical protein ACIA8C_33910 [Nocardia sp. NPDC051321]|uniref:hypothetical protein n=1 Tax=Nocardia sp. NPDC051321 TaxID=3364323 RepID=UPI00379242F5
MDPAAVLSPEALLAAISGHLDSTAPLVAWARALGNLHATLIPDPRRGPNDFDAAVVRAQIARIVAAIDAWASSHVPRNPNARNNTHSLGEVLSQVARTYAHARWTVLHPADQHVQHAAWMHLGEVREGYARLVADLSPDDQPASA